MDAYCGIGTISLFLAQRASVEIVKEAIEDGGFRTVRGAAGGYVSAYGACGSCGIVGAG